MSSLATFEFMQNISQCKIWNQANFHEFRNIQFPLYGTLTLKTQFIVTKALLFRPLLPSGPYFHPVVHVVLPLFFAILCSCACVCACACERKAFPAHQSNSHPVRGNIVNVADTVPSAYLQLVLNNRKPGEMSSPVIMWGLFLSSCPYSFLGVN